MGKNRRLCVLCRETADFGHVLCLTCQEKNLAPNRRCRFCPGTAIDRSCYCGPCHTLMLRQASKREKSALAEGKPLPAPRERSVTKKPPVAKCGRCNKMAGRRQQFCRPCRVIMGQAKPKRSKRQRFTATKQPSARKHRVIRPLYCYSERNHHLRKLGFPNYTEYLKSITWTDIRDDFLRKNPLCCKCGGSASQVHHSKYTEDNLRGRSTQFLHAVCRQCHENAEIAPGRKFTLDEANVRLGITKPKPDFRKTHNHWKGPPKTAVKRRPITNEAGVTTSRSRETESASDPQLG